MRRKPEQGEPDFKGIDQHGEPIFVWYPETPEWVRREHVAEWKRIRALSRLSRAGEGE